MTLPTFNDGAILTAAQLRALNAAITDVQADADAAQAAADQIKATSSLNVKRDFGAVGDGIANDTLPIANGIYAACLANAELFFPAGLYSTGPQTIGATGSYRSCTLRGERMHAQYADTIPAVGKGTILQLRAGSNGHLITVPPADAFDVGPASPLICDMWLDGNASAQTGAWWLVNLPNHTATANKCRSAFLERVRGSNAAGGGVRAGLLRNAGRIVDCAILGTTGPAFETQSCNDWRIDRTDLWSIGNSAYYAPGGGSVIFTATNFFSSAATHGVKIDATASDHTFFGCSFDRNARSGIYVLGSGPSVVLVGCRFTLNSQSAHDTYADVVADGGNRLSLIGCFFDTGSLPNRPKYAVETKNGASAVVVLGTKINEAGEAAAPYVTAFTNDTAALIQAGDALTAANFLIDYDPLAANRVRVKGGAAFNPAIVGVFGEENAALSVYAQTTGALTIGRSTNKLSFYDQIPARSKQTVAGSRASGAALADLLTKLANLGLITDGTSA